MKIIRIAATIVGVVAAVALVATGVGAPLGVGLASFFGGIASAATWGVVALGASLLATAATMLSPKPRSLVSGHPEDFRADPQAYLPYMIGRTSNAGNIIHRDTFGEKGLYQGFVVIWSAGGPVEEIEGFYVDNVLTTFNGSTAAVGDYSGFMWLDTQLGACPESGALVSAPGSLPGWGSSSGLSGYAAGLWTLKFDTKGKKYTGGVPQPRALIKGVKVYDPRLDSTYPGGSGSCRALVESTYVWSENPWLHALTFALGRFQNGRRVLGVGIPIASIDVAAFVEAANIADANNWKAGGTVFTGDSKWQILKSLAQAGGGECMQLGAKLSCLVSTPRVSLATITSADLVGRASVTGTQSRRDRINGVTPRIRSEAHGWEVIPLDVVRGSTYLTEDGQERTREIDYQLVQDADQAAQLAAYDIANAREFGPISLPLKPVWLGYRPGDCITCNIPEMGLNSQPCIQLNRELEPASGVVTLSLRSETAAKHAYALGQTGTAPPTPSLAAPDFSVSAPAEDVWTLAAVALEGTSGESVPILRISGEVDNTNAEAVVFEYRIEGETNWQSAGIGSPDTISFDISSIVPGASYEVAVSYQVRGVKGDQIILGPVTADALMGVGGGAGADGLNSASVFIYKRSASAPTLPSADTTYTFATGGLTGLNNGWTRSVPSGADPLYVSLATAVSSDATDDILAAEWATAVILAQDGTAGLNNATVFLYQRNGTGTPPSGPGSTLTYTFSTGVLSGTLGSWSQTPPVESGGAYLFITTAAALGTGSTDTIGTGEWSTVRQLSKIATDGTNGTNGLNNAIVYLYQRAASPPTVPGGTTTYTFATGVLTGTLGSWTQAIPSGSLPIYVIAATASAATTTDTIATGEWTSPVVMAQDGAAGLNSATVYLYQRATTPPSVPAGTLTYTFATAALSGTLGSWAQTIPAGSTPIYVTTATALGTGSTDTIATGEWATPAILAQNGADGTNAKIVSLDADRQAFTFNQAGTLTPSGQTSLVIATAANLTAGSVVWTYSDNLGTASSTLATAFATTPAANQRSISDPFSGTPTRIWLKITATGQGAENVFTDTVTLVRLQDGANGVNAIVGFLTNEDVTLPADSTGAVLSYATATGSFKVYSGVTDVSSSFALSTVSNSQSLTIGYSSQTYTVTTAGTSSGQFGNTGTDSASVTIRATGSGTYSGVTVDKVLTLAKSKTGAGGANGLNNAVVYLYQRAASSPSVPAGTLTYTYATGLLSGTLGSWTQAVPAGTNPLYVIAATASSTGTTDTITTGEWTSAVIMAQDGAAGSAGLNSASVFLYQRAASAPSVPGGTLTYTFATGVLSGTLGSWTQAVPSGGNPLYVTTATALGTGATDTIATGEWASPAVLAQDGATGAAGQSTATVYLYQRATSTPSVPAGTTTYTFATAVLSGTLGSWTQTVPSGTDPIYVTTATALGTGTTDTIATGEWASPRVLAQNGSQVVSVFSRSLVQPSTPTGNGTPSGWGAAPIARAADFVPISTSGLSVNADYRTFQKVGGSNGVWDQSFRSTAGGSGLSVRFRPGSNNQQFMVGLNSDPATSNSYTDIDYAAFCGFTGQFYAFSNATNLGVVASYVAGDDIEVAHRGTTVVLLVNGSIVYTFTGVSATATLYVDSSFAELGATATSVEVTNGQLWVSQAVQDIAGNTAGSWSTPILFDGQDGQDGIWRDTKYQRSYSQPATPTVDDPAGWFDGVPDGTATLWQSVGLKSLAGGLIGAWSIPKSISGITPRGEYAAATSYYLNNLVTWNGGSYVATQDGFSGHAPSGTAQANAYWDVYAAPGPPGTPAVPPSPVSSSINLSSGSAINLRTVADANGYTGASDATLTFNVPSGVTIRGLSGGGKGIDSGSWPTSSYAISLTLVVQSGGVVDGGGGDGGAGSSGGGGDTGGDGGDAIFCRLPMAVTVNSGGTLRGGGGGGGGGNAKARKTAGETFFNGGSGGGGGFPNGNPGIAGSDSSTGNNGSAGTTSGGGSGGAPVLGGGAGGAGGGAGAAGTAGNGASGVTGAGGLAGAAGYAVRKNGFTVTVTNNGTMTGTAA